MLHRDDRGVAFALEKALELVEQIFVDFAASASRSFVNSCQLRFQRF